MPLPEGLKDFTINDKAAVVIGAEHPVGRAAAMTLAEAGARVLLASQTADGEPALRQTAAAIEAAGYATPPIRPQDAVSRTAVKATLEAAVAQLGAVDIVVTALDRELYAPFDEADDEAFGRVMDDNVKSVWIACQEAARLMLQRGGGVIVNISNVMAERGVPNATLYCAAKGAVRNLVRAMSLELARRNIRINMIECGWLSTEGSPARVGEFGERLVKYLPYRRLLEPQEIAGALLYLVSPAAGFVTGEAIAVDGGLLCRV
jgi:NAD(P)-dependent dehydrogenase (short-subunit alcohol dehydrogenase family)